MLKAQNLSKSYDGQTILSNVSLCLKQGEKAVLVGQNGSGKSTLLKILADLEKPDSGTIEIQKEQCVGYLPQELEIQPNKTIGEYLKNFTEILQLGKRMRELEKELNNPAKLEEYSELQQIFLKMDGYSFENKAKIILKGFGIPTDLDWPIIKLSGGQKSKLALTGVLLKGVDILLLDEPTNNLDLPAIIWLESFLAKTKTSCLLVSHDRKFVDKIASKIFEIDWLKRNINEFTGTFSDYISYKQKKIRKEKETLAAQQEKIEKLEKSSRVKKEWAQKGSRQTTKDNDKYIRGARRDRSAKIAQNAKTIEKRMQNIRLIEVTNEQSPLDIPLNAQCSSQKHSIILSETAAGFKDGFKIEPVNLVINYGSRIGIIGANGSGKTTLLKTISGLINPLSGKVSIGSSLIIGNLTQEHENLPREKTIFNFLKDAVKVEEQKIFFLLSKFHFPKESADKKISSLSPGERSRLILLSFCAISVNVLILDEPTNHLDLNAIEAFENLLQEYTGTIIVVSHDRYFIDKINPDYLFILDNKELKQISSYNDYALSIESKIKRASFN